MITYYGYTISPNQLETGEGFLICRNVPIARTGMQQYRGREIGLETDEIVEVWRPESEVFDPAAMASFEGKPVTNDHPTEPVTPDNTARYEMGHIQNIRRGTGALENFLLGDIHITHTELIDAVRNGKRQISCGYECEYIEKDGKIYQSNIRGNHVAVVDEGRAGVKAAIMDSINSNQPEKAERTRRMSRKSSILKLFGLAASGRSEEELNRLALDTADALEEQAEVKAEEKVGETAPVAADQTSAEEKPAELTEKEQTKVETEIKDAVSMETLNEKLDKLISLLTPKAEPEKAEVEVETKEDIDSAIEKLDITGEEAAVVPAEEMDACGGTKDAALDTAAQKMILSAVRASVAGISDEKQRQAVTDAILGAVRSKKNDLQGILQAQSSFQSTVHKDTNEELQARYAARNPHNKK